jgi:hypothetical protein
MVAANRTLKLASIVYRAVCGHDAECKNAAGTRLIRGTTAGPGVLVAILRAHTASRVTEANWATIEIDLPGACGHDPRDDLPAVHFPTPPTSVCTYSHP